MAEVEEKKKYSLRNCKMRNEELKGSTSQLKLQDEELQNLRQEVEIWETT